MTKELKQLLLAAQVCLLILWPACAWAAAITYGESMVRIPMLSWLLTVALSTLFGGMSLLNTIRNELIAKGRIDYLGLFIASKMVGSNGAGMLAFLGAEALGLKESTPVAICLSAFGGILLLERWSKSYTNRIAPE